MLYHSFPQKMLQKNRNVNSNNSLIEISMAKLTANCVRNPSIVLVTSLVPKFIFIFLKKRVPILQNNPNFRYIILIPLLPHRK